jgi:hypothetical protein
MKNFLILLTVAMAIVGSYFVAIAINPPQASEGLLAFATIALPGIVTGVALAIRAIWNVRGRSVQRRTESAGIIDLVEARRERTQRREEAAQRLRDSDAA